jgi:hypothetical protein
MEDRSVFLYFLRGVPTKIFLLLFFTKCFLFIEFFFFQNIEYFFCCFFEGDFLQKELSDGSTLHTTHYTLHTTHYTLHTTHYTLHSTLYTLHSTLYTLHSTVYIMQDVYCCLIDGGCVGYREMSLLSRIE